MIKYKFSFKKILGCTMHGRDHRIQTKSFVLKEERDRVLAIYEKNSKFYKIERVFEEEDKIKIIPTTTCQICGRAIQANTGIIAHHGYQRPYDGFQTSSCEGARFLPYEESRDRIPYVINLLNRAIESDKSIIEKIKNKEISVYDKKYIGKGEYEHIEIKPDDAYNYKRVADYRIREIEFRIKQMNNELNYLQKRFDDWKEPVK